jgi:hypothetical protein
MRRMWRAVRRLLRWPEPPSEPPWPDEEPALVPLGPRPWRPSAAAVLEPPAETDPLEYPTETDAVGPVDVSGDDDETEGLRAAAR